MVEKQVDKQSLKIAIAGVNGRMGRASARLVLSSEGFELVGAIGKKGADYIGKSVESLLNLPPTNGAGILVSNGIEECLKTCRPDVLLDLTNAQSSVLFGVAALKEKIRVVIGTSGVNSDQLNELESQAIKNKTGVLVVPNFSIGAILMMNFAKQAAAHFENAEVVETHRLGKLDAPSGTAMHTLKEMETTGKKFNQTSVKEHESLTGARGGKTESGLRVHSLRLPGVLSHQDVIFAGAGEMLSIRHDSFNTDCFNSGIVLSLKSVMKLDSLVVGLDRFVFGEPEAKTN